MKSARGTAVSDVLLAAHRLWRSFTPDSDLAFAFALACAATEGVFAEFLGFTNPLLLSLRCFHIHAGRGYVRTPTESHPNSVTDRGYVQGGH